MRVLLCDLDDTLFDHQHATRTALTRLRDREPRLQAWDLETLKARHHELLEVFHQRVLSGELTIDQARDARFSALVGGGDASGLAAAYREAYLADWREVPGARALLAAVRARGASVVIVTNSTVAEQRLKLDRLSLAAEVDALVTSEEVGVQKPDPSIFHAALDRVGASAGQAVMLGDAWRADVEGARAAGVRPVWLNRFGLPAPDPAVTQVPALSPVEHLLPVLWPGQSRQ